MYLIKKNTAVYVSKSLGSTHVPNSLGDKCKFILQLYEPRLF